MTNPVFNNTAVFREPRTARQRGRGATPGALPPYGPAPTAYDPATLDAMYGAPSATTAQTGRLTYDDVIVKTSGLLAVVVAAAAFAWFVVPDALRMPVALVGALVGFVLGLVNSFKQNPSPALIVLYAAAEGLFLGGFSWYIEVAANLPGIVMQAVLATMATFAACLMLFRSGRVRVTPKFTRWLLVAMVGYLIFSLVNFGLAMFSVGDGMFGPLRSGALGMAVGLLAVGLA